MQYIEDGQTTQSIVDGQTIHYIEDGRTIQLPNEKWKRTNNDLRSTDAVYHIYPTELEIKDTTDTARSASYFDIHLENDIQVRLTIKPHYK
jgi:hypothetical protein